MLERTHEAWGQVSLRIKAQLLISLQHMIVVAGGTHSQRMEWGVTEAQLESWKALLVDFLVFLCAYQKTRILAF